MTRRIFFMLIPLLLLWATRIPALDALPLHNDEGLHLTRAAAVYRGHPFWDISDGKIINHWGIAAFFHAGQHPELTGRIATLFTAMIGLAAGLALAGRLGGLLAAGLAGALWISSPYLYFFERLALSDAQAGALAVLAVLLAWGMARAPGWRAALGPGLALAAAVLLKFTAAPYVLSVALIALLLDTRPLNARLLRLVQIALISAACFAPPLLYLLLRGSDFFSIALGWLGIGGTGGRLALIDNAAGLWAWLIGFGTPLWAVLLLIGLAALAFTGRTGRALLAAALLPPLLILLLGREVLPRHIVVSLPLMLTLAGVGLAHLVARLPGAAWRIGGAAALAGALLAALMPFAWIARTDPGALPLPRAVSTQYIADHSGGFGLREAMRALPALVDQPDLPIIGSMFPDGCRRANFYAVDELALRCGDAPGAARINQALADSGAVYVLTDEAPLIGIDVTQIDAQAVEIARFPRPDETPETASVVLWLLRR